MFLILNVLSVVCSFFFDSSHFIFYLINYLIVIFLNSINLTLLIRRPHSIYKESVINEAYYIEKMLYHKTNFHFYNTLFLHDCSCSHSTDSNLEVLNKVKLWLITVSDSFSSFGDWVYWLLGNKMMGNHLNNYNKIEKL